MTLISSVRKELFKVDLATIEGNGEFPCPNCATVISPDDYSDQVYTVLSIPEDEDNLETMTIQCNKCRSIITLNGFEQLS